MEVFEISKIEDSDTQLKAIITKAMQDPRVIPAYLQTQLAKLAKSQEGLSHVLPTVEDGCDENTRKQLTNTMRSVIHQNRILQHVINVLIVYMASKSYYNDTSAAAINAGANNQEVLSRLFKQKMNGQG